MRGYEVDRIPKLDTEEETINISDVVKEKVDSFTIDSLTAEDNAMYDKKYKIQSESNDNENKKANNFNIFQALELFLKEGFLNKEDKKTLNKFERDLSLEAKLIDNSLSYDDLTPSEVLKMAEYFSLISKLTPKLESANPKKINDLIQKYSENDGKNKPFKKQRFRDVKRNIKKEKSI